MPRLTFALIIFFVLQSDCSFAQNTKIVLRNTPEESISIELKWYSQKLLYKNGVDVYRRAANSTKWQKLNRFPIKGFQQLSNEAIDADSTLLPFTAMAKEISKPNVNGLLLLNVILKSFISTDYSKYLGIYYLDEGLGLGKEYQYKIVEYGNENMLVKSEIIRAGIYKSGSAVDSLKVLAGEKMAKLKWKLEEERFYATNVYRKKQGHKSWIKINRKPVLITAAPNEKGKSTIPEYLFVDDSLEEGSTYEYKVAGLDFFGSETKMSDMVSVFIKDLTLPYPPKAFRKDSVRKLKVYLSWHRAKEDAEKDYVGYKIFRSNKSDGAFVEVSPHIISKTDTQYVDIVSMPNPFYYYVVTVDESGNEAKSNSVFVEVPDVFPPKAPLNVKIVADTGRIILNWDRNKESDVKGYHIYRTALTDNSNNFVLLNAYPHLDTIFIDKLPKRARSKFVYKIQAIDSTYNKSDYSKVVGISMPDIIAPEQPIIKSIKIDSNGVLISWIANVELDLMHYILYRKIKGDSLLQKISNIAKQKKYYFDNTVKIDEIYQYALVAIDSALNQSEFSPYFAVAYISNDKIKTDVEKNNFKAKYNKANSYVKLKWQVNNEANYIGAIIFRKDSTNIFKPLTGMLKQTDYIDNRLDKQIYWYEHRTYFTDGTVNKSEVLKVELK